MKIETLRSGDYKVLVSLPEWAEALGNKENGNASAAYLASAWAFRAVGLRADAIASAPLKLYDRDESEIEQHPILDVLNNVNAEWNRSDLWRYTEAGLLVYGSGYWQKVRAGRRVRELFYLNPSTVELKTNAQGITGFTQRITGRTSEFPREDVVYFRGAYDPHSDLTGIPALKLALIAALGESNADKYLNAFFQNGAVPALVLATEQQMPDATIEKVRAWWNRLFRGVKQQHKVGIIGNGLKPIQLGSNVRDLALAEVRAEMHRTISTALGVPELLISPTNAADLTPVKMAEEIFYNTTISPRWRWYEELLNFELLGEFKDLTQRGCYLKFDTSKIDALQENRDSKAARLSMLVREGIIKPEVAAVELGYQEEDVPSEPAVEPEPEIPPNTEPEEEPATDEAQEELTKWMRKVIKAVGRGKAAEEVPFESNVIPSEEQACIRAELKECLTVDEIREVFRRPTVKAVDNSRILSELQVAVRALREAA